MTTTMLAALVGAFYLVTCYRMAEGNTGLNLLSSFGLILALVWLLPELRGIPVAACCIAWGVTFIGLQFVLPAVDGRSTLWQWQTARFMVAVAVA